MSSQGVPSSESPYQQFIYKTRYARWLEDKKRRENWDETVSRYIEFFKPRIPAKIREEVSKELYQAIYNLEVMPSMRALMTAGKALEKDALAGYNCSYIAVDDPRAFDEALFASMCFSGDTKISTKEGLKDISKITSDDEVKTFNLETKEISFIKTSGAFQTPSKDTPKIELLFEDGSVVTCTEDHLFLTDKGFVAAKDLTGDHGIIETGYKGKFINQNGDFSLRIISKKTVYDPSNYWDLTVPKTHTFILANGVVVHNCGVGVGFSVERQFVNLLPTIAEDFHETESIIHVRDSKIGWASSLKELISLLYSGAIPKWDLSSIRQKGAKLKTFGGRASGPEPLDRLFKFVVRTFTGAAGRKLTSLECHDILCHIGDCAVSGGVRRSAEISLSNLSDDRMRNAKNGQWWLENGQRALANNSAVYTEKPDTLQFLREWTALIESRSGERGIFNRRSAQLQAKRSERRKWEGIDFGTNPCGEIILNSAQCCNLTEVVIRPTDTKAELKRKIRLATILGTLQSTLTDFRYLRRKWRQNCEEERLLGVSLTGIMDHPILSKVSDETAKLLSELKNFAISVNKEYAALLDINPSAAITCVKPSGTVSQRVNTSSGIHTRYAPYILRAVRNDRKDPISEFLKAVGVPNEPDITKPNDTDVFYFPLKSPESSKCRKDLNALEQLEMFLQYRLYWCEHNPSCTIYVKDHEWFDVAAWIYKNFNEVGGISFLPYSDHVYKQAPYEEISKEQYEKLRSEFPVIDWAKLEDFEKEDTTTATKELACAGGVCELA